MDELEAKRTLEFFTRSAARVIAEPSFPEQNAFVFDKNQFIAAQCTRRAGKSNGLALRFFRTMEKFPGCFCPYIALTRESAKNIMWDIIQDQAERFGISAEFTESNLTMTMANGSRLQLFGADMKNFIKRLKGIKTPGAAIDEAQDFGSHIASLVDDVLTPATADYGEDGWIAVTGTPGLVPSGYFYEITEKRKHGFTVHKWTLYQNPFMPDPRGFVARLKAKKEWSDENPTFLREYMNQWVLDLDALVYKFQESKNLFSELPKGHHYMRILTVDYGWHDQAAIGITTFSYTLRKVFTEYTEGHGQLIPSALAKRVVELKAKYSPFKLLADTGGLGKSITEEFKQRYHLPFEAAEKREKKTAIRLMNGDFIDGHALVHESEKELIDQYKALKKPDDWQENENAPPEKPGLPNDRADVALYGYRSAKHFLGEEKEDEPDQGTPQAYELEAKRMLEKEMDDFANETRKEWWEVS
jgi:hypothetical protein